MTATVYFMRHPPNAYPEHQLQMACILARHLNRGHFLLLAEPEDAK